MSLPRGKIDKDSVESLRAELIGVLPAEDVREEQPLRALYSSDLLGSGPICALVVRPRTIAQLSHVLRTCAAKGFVVAPRGGGLTYVGGYTPDVDRWVSLDMSGFNRILEISADDMFVTVEAGVTWKQLYDALEPLGLRAPFFGTFSGRHATVGGGLSNGALFFGSARYGTAADQLLGLEVMRADGQIVGTGASALRAQARPGFRGFGPDLTGAFTHDGGALGVKIRATLRLIRAPAATHAVSFRFADRGRAIGALSELARRELTEDLYLMDAAKTAESLSGGGDLKADLQRLLNILRADPGLNGAISAARIAIGGRRIARPGDATLHAVLAARSAAALAADLRELRDYVHGAGGREIPPTIPGSARADLFPPPAGILGPGGQRWIALNAKVPHSQAVDLVSLGDRITSQFSTECAKHKVRVACLMTALYNNCFSYEPVITWPGPLTPLHEDWVSRLELSPEPSLADLARESLVTDLREAFINGFRDLGAVSTQIGRTYPYVSALTPESAGVVLALKTALDPSGLMNPGVLGLQA